MALPFFALAMGLFYSCRSNIEYVTTYGFELSHDEYRHEVGYGVNNKIRIYIQEKSELRDNYYVIKYFSSEGSGKAYYDRELKELVPNEWFLPTLFIDKVSGSKYVEFNYTPYSYGSHKMSFRVRDIGGREQEVQFQFNVTKPKQ